MIQLNEAGPVGLIKIILIIAFIYYAFKFLMKMFGPYLMNKAVKKMQEKAEQKFAGKTSPEEPTVKTGETIIDKRPTKTNKTNDSVGEYVDFEEID